MMQCNGIFPSHINVLDSQKAEALKELLLYSIIRPYAFFIVCFKKLMLTKIVKVINLSTHFFLFCLFLQFGSMLLTLYISPTQKLPKV